MHRGYWKKIISLSDILNTKLLRHQRYDKPKFPNFTILWHQWVVKNRLKLIIYFKFINTIIFIPKPSFYGISSSLFIDIFQKN